MLKFIGTEKDLEELGFVKNIYGSYWFLPQVGVKKPSYPISLKYPPLVINCDDFSIECHWSEQLKVIEGLYIKE